MRKFMYLLFALMLLALLATPASACNPAIGANVFGFNAAPVCGGGFGGNFAFNAGYGGGFGFNAGFVHQRAFVPSFSPFVTQPFIGVGGGANVNIVQRGGLFGRRTSVIQASAGGLGGASANVIGGGRRGGVVQASTGGGGANVNVIGGRRGILRR